MAETGSPRSLRYNLEQDTLNRISKAQAAKQPGEGQKTNAEYLQETIKGIQGVDFTGETAKALMEAKVDSDFTSFLDNVNKGIDRGSWTNTTTVDQVKALQMESRNRYLAANPLEQANILATQEAQASSLNGWKDLVELAGENWNDGQDQTGLWSEGYLKNHPDAAYILEQIATQEGTSVEFDENNEMIFKLADGKKVTQREFRKILESGLKVDFTEHISGAKALTAFNYDDDYLTNKKMITEDNILQIWNDGGVIGNESLKEMFRKDPGFLREGVPVTDANSEFDIDGSGKVTTVERTIGQALQDPNWDKSKWSKDNGESGYFQIGKMMGYKGADGTTIQFRSEDEYLDHRESNGYKRKYSDKKDLVNLDYLGITQISYAEDDEINAIIDELLKVENGSMTNFDMARDIAAEYVTLIRQQNVENVRGDQTNARNVPTGELD